MLGKFVPFGAASLGPMLLPGQEDARESVLKEARKEGGSEGRKEGRKGIGEREREGREG